MPVKKKKESNIEANNTSISNQIQVITPSVSVIVISNNKLLEIKTTVEKLLDKYRSNYDFDKDYK